MESSRLLIRIIRRFFADVGKEFFLTSRCVYVVDDDQDVRSSIGFMLGTADVDTRTFADGPALLEALTDAAPGCILLDVRMPGMDGFQVMAELEARGIDLPVIVMTGHGEVAVAVRAMKTGAVDFIEKPFGEELVLASLERAFLLLKDRGDASDRKRIAKERVAALTPREREVLQGLTAGMSNKLLARQFDLSLRTIEMHRANMMNRLQVTSLAEALTLAAQAELGALDKSGPDQPV